MKGKIDSQGFLHTERAGVMKQQECHDINDGTEVYSRNQNGQPEVIMNIPKPCGDWCPLFGEPSFGYKTETTPNDDGITFNSKKIYNSSCTLSLCKALRCFDDFTDERGVK